MHVTLHLLAVLPVIAAIRGAPPTNCTRRCGDIEVPYPFGINDGIGNDDCYLLPDMALTCNHSSIPPKLTGSSIQLSGITLSTGQIHGLLPMSCSCYNLTSDVTWNVSLKEPYTFSNTDNAFVTVGCEAMGHIGVGGGSYGCCLTLCGDTRNIVDGQCAGLGCCRHNIPRGLKSYETSFYRFKSKTREEYEFSSCTYSFMVEKGYYSFHRSDLRYMDRDRLFPVVVDWSIGKRRCSEAVKDKEAYACLSDNSVCVDPENSDGYICNCSKGYRGNPYLTDGCQDIDECSEKDLYPCNGICTNTPGSYSCSCPDGFYADDPKAQNCTKARTHFSRVAKLSIGAASGLVLLVLSISVGYLHIQRRTIKKLRDRYFHRNGGVFLQEILSLNRRSTFKIFTIRELEDATDNFHSDNILGRGGFGTVYRGKLPNGIIAAIKKPSAFDDKRSKEFANEMFIISQINHRNVVKLLGCCLEIEIPMLVYEYVTNGTLFAYLHHKCRRIRLPLASRLKVAREAAQALRYLHCDASPPILHGDVKSSNILLDEGYTAKVSDFGTSVLAPMDKAQVTTLIQGTYGYLDPRYIQTGRLTDKSDVYSFGVVLAELLTRRLAVDFDAPAEERSLAFNFVSAMDEDGLAGILDDEIAEEGLEEVKAVAEIARRCLRLNGEERPTMDEVAAELEKLKGFEVHHPWGLSLGSEMVNLLVESSTRRCDVSAALDLQNGR